MLQISAKTDYGLLLMTALAASSENRPISLKQIARERRLPYRFLSQIAMLLRHAGLIEAKEGAGGGYRLTRPAKRISVAAVLGALEGDLQLVRCHEHDEAADCPVAASCTLSPLWTGVSKRLAKAFGGMTIADLAQKVES
ncbi:MAG: Rrf2 family transcriptional regulator [Candidatus Kerfeldbacteria bacterium]|nr:Rrf2 family transcriptional regulator [Candidatus Kerfeldbacteria bacterium]